MVLGLIILIGAFIKLEYLYLLQRQMVDINGTEELFQDVLIDPSITPFYVLILWNYLIAACCAYMIVGIVITAGGLNKGLKIEKGETIIN